MLRLVLRFVGLFWLISLAFLYTFNQVGQPNPLPFLAYVLNSGYENADIILADMSSGISINISSDEAPNGNPHWSNDGRYLVFRSSHELLWTFFVLDTENWQIRELVSFTENVDISSIRDNWMLFRKNTSSEGTIISLETGEEIEISLDELFSSCMPSDCFSAMYYSYQLELSLVDDAVFVEIVDIDWTTTDFNTLAQQMLWAADGESYIFRSNLQGQNDLYLGTMEGGFAQRLTNSPEVEDMLVWSRDKQWISFTRLVNGYSDVFVLEIATGQLRNISQSLRPDSHPVWRP